MTYTRKRLGLQGEEIAVEFLTKQKYKILARNYRCRYGEIDIVAQHKRVLSFVEVKTRSSKTYGAPQDAVGPVKQKKLSRVAQEYLQRHGLENSAARFDVVAVTVSDAGYSVELIQNAFDVST
ncbi:MAG: YraN family protein [Deltaproteobacteria bacterium]|nr:YraN family protein [Deltaproteobacteria bacterium]